MPESSQPQLDLFPSLYQQAWENARFIKNERLVFANIYAIVVAGTLSFLSTNRSMGIIEIPLIGFLWVFSLVALLTSIRLKAELEDCLEHIHLLSRSVNVDSFISFGEFSRGLVRHVKFRWVFPVLYSLTSTGFLVLLIYRIVARMH